MRKVFTRFTLTLVHTQTAVIVSSVEMAMRSPSTLSMTIMEIVQMVQMSNGMTVEHLTRPQMTVRCGMMMNVKEISSIGMIATMAPRFGA